MKNKWLWITLSVVLVLVLLAGTAFVFMRIGMMRRIAPVATGSRTITDNCVQVTVSENGEIIKGACELLEDSEGQTLEVIPGTAYSFRGMMRQNLDRFDRFSYNPRTSMMGSRISMFSPLRWLGGLVLLALLVLLVILIVKALSGKTRMIIKTQPEVVEVPPVEPYEQE